MARLFIIGSADGLGRLAAQAFLKQGHQVVLHARHAARGRQALAQVPGAEAVLTAYLSSLDETRKLAQDVNAFGRFDTIIHNAGVYQAPKSLILSVNTLAPYVLTCLIQKPQRLIYLSSGMHFQGDPSLKSLTVGTSRYGSPTYSDAKLHDLLLSKVVARNWSDVYANAVDPGWVPTKMGGAGAPDDLEKGFETQVWLAVSNDYKATVSGRYFHHQNEAHYLPAAEDAVVQDNFLSLCEQITGVRFPVNQA